MAGILSVQQIQGLATAADPTTVQMADGHVLKQPGSVVQSVHTFLKGGSDYGSGTDPTVGNHTGTSSNNGPDVDGDGYWESHVVSITTTSPTATDFEVNITPKFSDSIIRIEHNPHIYSANSSDALGVRFVRTISGGTATTVYQPQTNTTGAYGLWYAGAQYLQPTIIAFDKPATTSSVNYKVYVYTYNGGTHYYGGHLSGSQWAPKQYLAVYEIAQ